MGTPSQSVSPYKPFEVEDVITKQRKVARAQEMEEYKEELAQATDRGEEQEEV